MPLLPSSDKKGVLYLSKSIIHIPLILKTGEEKYLCFNGRGLYISNTSFGIRNNFNRLSYGENNEKG